MDVPLRFFNTMGRKKQEFKPIEKGIVKLYSCGPTVYDYAHLGHFRAYVFVDVLKRVLRFNGLKVKHVMNITDVGHLTSDADSGEDKIEKKAKSEKKSAWEIAEFYTKDFFDAMEKLNVEKANTLCKATDHIEDMIEFIKKIEKNGYTYKTSDGIYFNTSMIDDYGKLAGLDKEKIENLKAGARVDFSTEKKNVTDFALWKFSPEGEKRQMEWDSPWGKGFPGWHIECSVMSMKYLGDVFDIHTGGIDHVTIHHPNEIAQAKAVTSKEPVRFWMHNEFLLVNGGKMSKSAGNFYNMEDFEKKGFDTMSLRYLFLTAHYRSKINFTWDSMRAADMTMSKLKERVAELRESKDKSKSAKEKVEVYRTEFIQAVNDDINTPIALSIMWKMMKDGDISDKDKLDMVVDFDKVFGLELDKMESGKKEMDEQVEELVKERENLRKEGKYEDADKIRDRLKDELGVIIEDTKNGIKWSLKKG